MTPEVAVRHKAMRRGLYEHLHQWGNELTGSTMPAPVLPDDVCIERLAEIFFPDKHVRTRADVLGAAITGYVLGIATGVGLFIGVTLLFLEVLK